MIKVDEKNNTHYFSISKSDDNYGDHFTYRGEKPDQPGKQKGLTQNQVNYLVENSSDSRVIQILQDHYNSKYSSAVDALESKKKYNELIQAEKQERNSNGRSTEACELSNFANDHVKEKQKQSRSDEFNHATGYYLKEERMKNSKAGTDDTLMHAFYRDGYVVVDSDYSCAATKLGPLMSYECEKWKWILEWDYENNVLVHEEDFRSFILAGMDYTGSGAAEASGNENSYTTFSRTMASGMQNHFARTGQVYGCDHK